MRRVVPHCMGDRGHGRLRGVLCEHTLVPMPAIAWSVRLVAAASSVLYALCSCSPSMRPLPIVCSHCVRMKARMLV